METMLNGDELAQVNGGNPYAYAFRAFVQIMEWSSQIPAGNYSAPNIVTDPMTGQVVGQSEGRFT